MTKGLDDGVRRSPLQVAKMLEIKTKEVSPPPTHPPTHPPTRSTDDQYTHPSTHPPIHPPTHPPTQVRQLETVALAKLQRALEPYMDDVLACARSADDRDRQGLYTAPFLGRDPVRYNSF